MPRKLRWKVIYDYNFTVLGLSLASKSIIRQRKMVMSKVKKRHLIPYKAHPQGNQLPAMVPKLYVEAAKFTQVISYADLRGMWKTVRHLNSAISSMLPDLIFFFATGGIPYMVPTLQLLMTKGHQCDAHMFPGLAWSGNGFGKSGMRYFVEKAACFIKMKATSKRTPSILFVDTTNTGNAVNRILKSIRYLSSINNVPTFDAQVIGIVNGKANRENNHSNCFKIKRCNKTIARIIRPSYWEHSSHAVWNRQGVRFTSKNKCDVTVYYWIINNIPTEDEAGLLGAKGIHDQLGVRPQTQAGRIVVKYPCGGLKEIIGGNTPGSNLMNLLVAGPKSASWKALRTKPSPLNVGVNTSRLFELLLSYEKSPDSISNTLLQKKGLFDLEEVYFLLSRNSGSLCNAVRKKICASLENHPDDNAVRNACRSALPEMAKSEDISDPAWWANRIEIDLDRPERI